ncbi:putative PAN/Apple domain-containing protein [Helianthus annuus]|nr:putative PAN/Apple domain-containing protein [Helianthus annuus]KAJ0752659.1 putative PAN/Apple domain-containing protein [Helianthus annuus]
MTLNLIKNPAAFDDFDQKSLVAWCKAKNHTRDCILTKVWANNQLRDWVCYQTLGPVKKLGYICKENIKNFGPFNYLGPVLKHTLHLLITGPERNALHWTSGPWENGEFKNTDLLSSGPDVRFYYVSNETEQSFTYLTRTYDSYPALRMHQDGHLPGSPLNLSVHCRYINDPPGCAEDEFERKQCRKDYHFDSTNGYYYNTYTYVDEYVYDESYNLHDCQQICWSNCSCVAFTTTRNRVGCKTYGKRVYNPETVDLYKRYYTIEG